MLQLKKTVIIVINIKNYENRYYTFMLYLLKQMANIAIAI